MEIFLTVFFVDILFIGIAYLLNENNAKYLLAGYNTMSKEEREKVDLPNFLIFWKNFFIMLTFITTLIFVISFFVFSESTATLIWALSLLIPWPIFIYKAQKFKK